MPVTNEVSSAPAPSVGAGQVCPPAESDAPPCGAGNQATLRHQILSAILAETEPAKLPPAWEFLRPIPSFGRLRRTPLELAALLRQTFSLEQLLAAQIFEQDQDNEPSLNPVFGDTTSQLLFFYSPNKELEEVIGPQRGLLFQEPSSVHYSCQTQESGQQAKRMLLADSGSDVHLLRLLGSKCMPAAGLERLSGQQVRRIFPPASSNKFGPKYKMTIVGWQPSLLDPRPTRLIEEILARFADVEQTYDIDPATRFDFWLAKPCEIDAIRLAASFRDKKTAQRFVTQSLESSTFSPDAARDATAKSIELDYAAARANLLRAISRSRMVSGSQDVRDASEKFKQAFDKMVSRKFYKAAASDSDPNESMLRLAADKFAIFWFETQEIMVMGDQAIAKRSPEYRSTIDPDKLDERLRLVNTLLKIRKSLLQGKE